MILSLLSSIFYFFLLGSKNETRCFQLRPCGNNEFEKDICTRIANHFLSDYELGEDVVSTVINELDNIDISDSSFVRKAISLIMKGTHFISSVSLGACETIESLSGMTNRQASVNLDVTVPHAAHIRGQMGSSRGASNICFYSIKRGNVNSVKINGTGEDKECVIDRVASPIYELLRPELSRLKPLLHSSIDIYTKRKSKWVRVLVKSEHNTLMCHKKGLWQ